MDDEKVIELLSLLSERQNSRAEYSDEEKIRAAYALNMCMVSVSQIIDYNDPYILEQEYETILNNLNIEMMPKDEALLQILKQLLDTITFFRIQEGEKIFIERDYQKKMKAAIWNAVPNFGLVVAGGNPVCMAISLASQVGIGYMNYRRAKSENALEKEKQEWQLHKSAIEQFNGLRRELFDTAWRLADTYHFPDAYRLTERQIRQYDVILMDYDEIRKFERLTTIKDNFIAYPPFWYQYGHTANHIARDENLDISDETRAMYSAQALESFEQYWKSNQYALLREDHIASACALEEIDLLDVGKDYERIQQLVAYAVKFSGYANDIIQLCSIAYLRIGDYQNASELLRILVNEDYNATVNAQILSGIYVTMAVNNHSQMARSLYETLLTRVDSQYLLEMPAIGTDCELVTIKDKFTTRQEELLKKKYNAVITYIIGQYDIKFGKILPPPNAKKQYSDSYFSSQSEQKQKRRDEIHKLFEGSILQKGRSDYLERLEHANFLDSYFNVLNSFFEDMTGFNCICNIDELKEIVEEQLRKIGPQLTVLAKKATDKKVDQIDIDQFFEFTSINIFKDFIDSVRQQAAKTITDMDDMTSYTNEETALGKYCVNLGIPEPDTLLGESVEAEVVEHALMIFTPELLTNTDGDYQQNKILYAEVRKIVYAYKQEIEAISPKASLYFAGSPEFNQYFDNSKLSKYRDLKQKTIAIYDNKTMQNADIMFTAEGIVPIIRNSVKNTIPYLLLASDSTKNRIMEMAKNVGDTGSTAKGAANAAGFIFIPGYSSLVLGGIVLDTNAINSIIDKVQIMFDEIADMVVRVTKH